MVSIPVFGVNKCLGVYLEHIPLPHISSYHTWCELTMWNVPSKPLGDKFTCPSRVSGAEATQNIFCCFIHWMRWSGRASKNWPMFNIAAVVTWRKTIWRVWALQAALKNQTFTRRWVWTRKWLELVSLGSHCHWHRIFGWPYIYHLPPRPHASDSCNYMSLILSETLASTWTSPYSNVEFNLWNTIEVWKINFLPTRKLYDGGRGFGGAFRFAVWHW